MLSQRNHLLLIALFGLALSACRNVATPSVRIDPALESIKREANERFVRSQYQQADESYDRGFRIAERQRSLRYMAWFLIGRGNCSQMQYDYRGAIQHYLRARRVAEAGKDREALGSAIASLASMYWRMGDLSAAVAAFEEALALPEAAKQNPAFWLNLGILYSHQGDFDAATRTLLRGISDAELKGDLFSAARGWNQLGWEYLRRGDANAAQGPLVEGFRLRKMLRSAEMTASYRNMAVLEEAKGNLDTAIRLLNESIRQGTKNGAGGLPLWDLYYHRGSALVKGGRLQSGLADFETAIALANRWRAEVMPAEALQTGAAVSVQRLFDQYIQACMGEFTRTRNLRWAKKAFSAAIEARARILRDQLLDRRKLSPEFWRSVAELRRAELKVLQLTNPENLKNAAAARLRVMELEMVAGLAASTGTIPKRNSPRKNETNSSENPLLLYEEGLSNGEALISFHVGEKISWVWSYVRGKLEVRSAPPAQQLAAMAAAFRSAVQDATPEMRTKGSELYASLFGALSAEVQKARSWLLIPDGPLYEIPFSALSRNGRFLVETTSIRLIAAGVPGEISPPVATRRFVGFGDPLYNIADSRWKGPRAAPAVELNRLPGSAREIEVCARAMAKSTPAVLLIGEQANRESLLNAIGRPAAVLHLATHVIPRPDIPDQNWIAIGLTPRGEPDFLTPVEIAASNYRVGLVSMTGCGSGTGKALRGVGLLGLARAWLVSGAGAVAASLWPVRDDSGELFQQFYTHFGNAEISTSRFAADTLRRAQIEMLHAGGWKAEPRYWAAFFIAGRN